jgi:hypothetical protein
MVATPETVRQVLRSWLAIEVLTPLVIRDGWSGFAAEKQGQQRNKGAEAQNGPEQWETPGDDDPTPWPLLPERPDTDESQDGPAASEVVVNLDSPRPWYSVVLAALPAKQAFERLDRAFSDDADEDETNRRTQGHIIAATVVLDQWGVLVPDTLALASFAWGLGHVTEGASAAELAGRDEREQDLKADFGSILAPRGVDGRFRSLSWRDLRAASSELSKQLGVPSELWVITPCAVKMLRKSPPDPDILSSFFLPDLGRVLRGVEHLPDAAAAYLGLRPPARPWDALTDRQQLSSLLEPALFPLARWPGPGLHPLTLLQQAAVNAVMRDLSHGGIAAVNGPPGTGKTTLLRDVVAHVLVSRAEKLANLDNPRVSLSGLNLLTSR